ncbi:hypothetical protein GJ496_000686 [Pomphorhynchus laevis]|nr:hypothetical protein GJ496_000686 [Pomphorhynchus laevis]
MSHHGYISKNKRSIQAISNAMCTIKNLDETNSSSCKILLIDKFLKLPNDLINQRAQIDLHYRRFVDKDVMANQSYEITMYYGVQRLNAGINQFCYNNLLSSVRRILREHKFDGVVAECELCNLIICRLATEKQLVKLYYPPLRLAAMCAHKLLSYQLFKNVVPHRVIDISNTYDKIFDDVQCFTQFRGCFLPAIPGIKCGGIFLSKEEFKQKLEEAKRVYFVTEEIRGFAQVYLTDLSVYQLRNQYFMIYPIRYFSYATPENTLQPEFREIRVEALVYEGNVTVWPVINVERNQDCAHILSCVPIDSQLDYRVKTRFLGDIAVLQAKGLQYGLVSFSYQVSNDNILLLRPRLGVCSSYCSPMYRLACISNGYLEHLWWRISCGLTVTTGMLLSRYFTVGIEIRNLISDLSDYYSLREDIQRNQDSTTILLRKYILSIIRSCKQSTIHMYSSGISLSDAIDTNIHFMRQLLPSDSAIEINSILESEYGSVHAGSFEGETVQHLDQVILALQSQKSSNRKLIHICMPAEIDN